VLTCLGHETHIGDGGKRWGQSRSDPRHAQVRLGRPNAVHERKPAIISAQQERVCASFPGTPIDRLLLLFRSCEKSMTAAPTASTWIESGISGA
jgi:hypothetical protein